MMRTEEARPVCLADYRPPDWLVETVHLDVRLDPTRSPVHATLKLRPNPAAGAPAPLNLDGDGLTLVFDRRAALSSMAQPVCSKLQAGIPRMSPEFEADSSDFLGCSEVPPPFVAARRQSGAGAAWRPN